MYKSPFLVSPMTVGLIDVVGDVIEFLHSYAEEGNYTVDVTSVNSVSEVEDFINMTVQNPVKALYFQVS